MRPTDEEIATVLRPFAMSANVMSSFGEDMSLVYTKLGDCRAARDLLSRLEAQSGEPPRWPWETIDTAPSEGDVLVFGGRHERVDAIHADGAYWRYARKEGSRSVPTHWMPLPPPPHVAPPASASSGSGRAEAMAAADAWVDGYVDRGRLQPGSWNALLETIHRAFLSGRRSTQEEAARVEPIPPPDFKHWMTACRNTFHEGVNSFRLAVRALNPETKP